MEPLPGIDGASSLPWMPRASKPAHYCVNSARLAGHISHMLPAKRTCFLVLLGYLVRVGPPFGVSRQSAVDLERSPGEGVEPLPGIDGASSLPWMPR
ncbi:MAG: hypothetical protein WCL54_07275, partial [Clostridia bacterium]